MPKQSLSDIKVLEFTWWLAGPAVGLYLANFGAFVIKVESETHPDLWRSSSPFRNRQPVMDGSGQFVQVNAGKHSIRLNLAHPQGRELAKKLVGWADIVVENFSPGAMERLGLGYEDLAKIKPDIIMASFSCLGQTGIQRGVRGNAFIGAAISGYRGLVGWPDRPPVIPASVGEVDPIQSVFGVIAVLAAVEYRRRTGKGQWLDVTQIEPMVKLIAPEILDLVVNQRPSTRMGNRHHYAAPHGVYRCKGDDRWCAIAVFSEEQWQGLRRTMGEPLWTNDSAFTSMRDRKKNEGQLDALIEQWTINLSAEEIMKRLQNQGVPSGAVHDPEDLVNRNPQLRDRGCFPRLKHPVIGECIHPAPPIRLTKTPASLSTAPLLGEHTEHICTAILGLSSDEFAKLLNAGVFE